MHWDDLRIIAAVRNCGTYAKAGKELRIDETTVSRRLARIQEALGINLFDAVDGMRQPTHQCEAVLAHIDEMALAAAKINTIGNLATKPSRNIRLTSTASIAEELLAPQMGSFLSANLGLSLDLQTSNENLNFSQWETDLAIRLGKPARGNFAIRKLAELTFFLFRPKTILENEKCFICSYPEELNDRPEMKALKSAGLQEPVRLKTSSVGVIRSVIKSHSGVGVLPSYMAGDLLNDDSLVVTALKERREVWLLIQGHLKNDPATRLVIDWIVEQLATVEG